MKRYYLLYRKSEVSDARYYNLVDPERDDFVIKQWIASVGLSRVRAWIQERGGDLGAIKTYRSQRARVVCMPEPTHKLGSLVISFDAHLTGGGGGMRTKEEA